MTESIETWLDTEKGVVRVGTLYREPSRGQETVSFEYHSEWLTHSHRFALEPALMVGKGRYYPEQGRAMFGALADSAPDTWGRQLMRRAERRRADSENRTVRTLQETDYLLGVSDLSRLGALRFKQAAADEFQAPVEAGVPGFVQLEALLTSARRIENNEETDKDLKLIFAPGSSLGGARPKASVSDRHGRLCIAKFPKDTDEYSIETWEHIALLLAKEAGIHTAEHELVTVQQRPVLLSRRFDRMTGSRVPFLSAMSMMQLHDGDRSSYPEIIDELGQMGASVKADAPELFRRMVFNILVSNVDDHLRNHGFLMHGMSGWSLSPAYDLNPTPQDVRSRILTTAISVSDASCSIELAMQQGEYFNLRDAEIKKIVSNAAHAVNKWRQVAKSVGQSARQIDRMASAFEHDDLQEGLRLRP